MADLTRLIEAKQAKLRKKQQLYLTRNDIHIFNESEQDDFKVHEITLQNK